MSDRVAFAGPFWNGFPFPPIVTTEDDSWAPWNWTKDTYAITSIGFLVLSPQELAKWWWKVKQINLQITIHRWNGTLSKTLSIARIDPNTSRTEAVPITRERDLQIPYWSHTSRPPDYTPTPAGPFFLYNPFFSAQDDNFYICDSANSYIYYRQLTGKYYFNFTIAVDPHMDISAFIAPKMSWIDGYPIEFTKLGEVEILGSTFDLIAAPPYPPDGMSASVTSIEYWPYAGKDGQPIFDADTGELLEGRDPVKS